MFDKLVGGIGKEAAAGKAAASSSAWDTKKPAAAPAMHADAGAVAGTGLAAAAAGVSTKNDDTKDKSSDLKGGITAGGWVGATASAGVAAGIGALTGAMGSAKLGAGLNKNVLDMTEAPRCVDIKEPTQIKSSLGNTLVYPDNFVGPLPKGAVRASDHERMLATYSNIESGHSSISIDTSNFFEGKSLLTDPIGYVKAMKDAAEFRSQYMGYLRDLVKTPTGLTMLSELDTSKHKTKITRGNTNRTDNDDVDKSLLKPDGSRNEGTSSTILMNPDLKSYKQPGETEQPWMTERERFGFYHELTHAYHDSRGETASGSHNGVQNWEWQVMGMGPYANEAVSDNKIRRDFDKQERPNYGGVTY